MILDNKISGLVVLSEPELGCYPYIESIKSFLPLVDELVIAFNVYGEDDGSRKKIEALGNPKIRIVSTVFDIEEYGWVSYGIARTMGYQACSGDIILMFDGDGVFHEKDTTSFLASLNDFIGKGYANGYWNKYRLYKPTEFHVQHKHSGIYNKKILGDRFDFFYSSKKGIPNWDRTTEQEQKSLQFAPYLFGYEHLWDTKDVLEHKINRYGRMADRVHNREFKTPEEYFDTYMRNLANKMKEKGEKMAIEKHPTIMQEKLKEINETHFGYNFFGYK